MNIKSPNPQYDGVTNGVQFTNGVGQTEDAAKKEWFQSHGYTVDGQAYVSPTGTPSQATQSTTSNEHNNTSQAIPFADTSSLEVANEIGAVNENNENDKNEKTKK